MDKDDFQPFKYDPYIFIDFDTAVSNVLSSQSLTGETSIPAISAQDFLNYLQSKDNLNLHQHKIGVQNYTGTSQIYLSSGSTTSKYITGAMSTPSNPVSDMLNVYHPTVNFIPDKTKLYTVGQIGRFFIPSKLGVLRYASFDIKPYILQDKITPNTLYVLPDPNVYGSGYGNTLKGNNLPIDHKENITWVKANPSTDLQEGMIIKSNNMPKFYNYSSKDEINKYPQFGISKFTDNFDFWSGSLSGDVWANPDIYKLDVPNQYPLASREEDRLLQQCGILYKWKTDVYGNEYALFKTGMSIDGVSFGRLVRGEIGRDELDPNKLPPPGIGSKRPPSDGNEGPPDVQKDPPEQGEISCNLLWGGNTFDTRTSFVGAPLGHNQIYTDQQVVGSNLYGSLSSIADGGYRPLRTGFNSPALTGTGFPRGDFIPNYTELNSCLAANSIANWVILPYAGGAEWPDNGDYQSQQENQKDILSAGPYMGFIDTEAQTAGMAPDRHDIDITKASDGSWPCWNNNNFVESVPDYSHWEIGDQFDVLETWDSSKWATTRDLKGKANGASNFGGFRCIFDDSFAAQILGSQMTLGSYLGSLISLSNLGFREVSSDSGGEGITGALDPNGTSIVEIPESMADCVIIDGTPHGKNTSKSRGFAWWLDAAGNEIAGLRDRFDADHKIDDIGSRVVKYNDQSPTPANRSKYWLPEALHTKFYGGLTTTESNGDSFGAVSYNVVPALTGIYIDQVGSSDGHKYGLFENGYGANGVTGKTLSFVGTSHINNGPHLTISTRRTDPNLRSAVSYKSGTANLDTDADLWEFTEDHPLWERLNLSNHAVKDVLTQKFNRCRGYMPPPVGWFRRDGLCEAHEYACDDETFPNADSCESILTPGRPGLPIKANFMPESSLGFMVHDVWECGPAATDVLWKTPPTGEAAENEGGIDGFRIHVQCASDGNNDRLPGPPVAPPVDHPAPGELPSPEDPSIPNPGDEDNPIINPGDGWLASGGRAGSCGYSPMTGTDSFRKWNQDSGCANKRLLPTIWSQKFKMTGNVFFRNLYSDTISPLSDAFASALSKFNSDTYKIDWSTVIDIDVIQDVLIIQTQDAYIFDRISFDYKTGQVQSNHIAPIYLTSSTSKTEKLIQHFYNEEDDIIVFGKILGCYINSDFRTVFYPELYKLDIKQFKLEKIYPNKYCDVELFALPTCYEDDPAYWIRNKVELDDWCDGWPEYPYKPVFDVIENDYPVISYNNKSKRYSVTNMGKLSGAAPYLTGEYDDNDCEIIGYKKTCDNIPCIFNSLFRFKSDKFELVNNTVIHSENKDISYDPALSIESVTLSSFGEGTFVHSISTNVFRFNLNIDPSTISSGGYRVLRLVYNWGDGSDPLYVTREGASNTFLTNQEGSDDNVANMDPSSPTRWSQNHIYYFSGSTVAKVLTATVDVHYSHLREPSRISIEITAFPYTVASSLDNVHILNTRIYNNTDTAGGLGAEQILLTLEAEWPRYITYALLDGTTLGSGCTIAPSIDDEGVEI